MKINICDYCLIEGKVVETLLVVEFTNHLTVSACKKHERKLVNDRNSDVDEENYQDLVAMISRNLLKRGKVLAGSKKRK